MSKTSKNLWNRLLWPVLALGLLAVAALQARAAGGLPRKASPAPPAASESARDRVAAEGRVVAYPGAEVVVGTDLAGTLVQLRVQEKQPVRQELAKLPR